MRFSNLSIAIVNSQSITLLATLDTILWKVSSGLQSHNLSRGLLRSSLLDVLLFSLLVIDEYLESEAILEWCSDAQQDGQNIVLN